MVLRGFQFLFFYVAAFVGKYKAEIVTVLPCPCKLFFAIPVLHCAICALFNFSLILFMILHLG